jgi:hypothetical protein
MSIWASLLLAGAAFLLGLAVGQAAAASRRSSAPSGNLEAAADRIKERWPAVHDDDIREAKGNLKRLSTVIGERTGESAREVREKLAAIADEQSPNGHS